MQASQQNNSLGDFDKYEIIIEMFDGNYFQKWQHKDLISNINEKLRNNYLELGEGHQGFFKYNFFNRISYERAQILIRDALLEEFPHLIVDYNITPF